MSYPKNSTSPPPIHVALVEHLTGLPVTSGVTVTHQANGAQAAAANTATHLGGGLWSYTPSQAETNYTAFSILWDAPGRATAESYIVTEAAASEAGTVQASAMETQIRSDLQDTEAALRTVTADGIRTEYDRGHALRELEYWARKANAAQHPRAASINLTGI